MDATEPSPQARDFIAKIKERRREFELLQAMLDHMERGGTRLLIKRENGKLRVVGSNHPNSGIRDPEGMI